MTRLHRAKSLGLGTPRPKIGVTPRLFEQIARALREQIASGTLPHGTVLRETAIAAEFRVSRAPARMALDLLEKEGSIETAGSSKRVIAGARDNGPVLPSAVEVAAEATWMRIYDDVESALVARMSFGSWRVVESDLGRHYGVSRTVAREVLGRLQQRGIVKKDHRSHWYVPMLGRDYVAELYEMRWTLEPAALLSAAPSLPSGLVARLLGNIDSAILRAAEIEGDELDRLERELHVELLGYCGNGAMIEAIRLYQSLLVAHGFLYRTAPRAFATEPFLPEHHDVLAALAAGHAGQAATALERHLRVSLDRAIYRIEFVRRLVDPEPLSYLSPRSDDAPRPLRST